MTRCFASIAFVAWVGASVSASGQSPPGDVTHVAILEWRCETGSYDRERLAEHLSVELELAGFAVASGGRSPDVTVLVDRESCAEGPLAIEVRQLGGRAWREPVTVAGETELERVLALKITELLVTRARSPGLVPVAAGASPIASLETRLGALEALAAFDEPVPDPELSPVEAGDESSEPRGVVSARLSWLTIGQGNHLAGALGGGVASLGPISLEAAFLFGGARAAVDGDGGQARYLRVGGFLEAAWSLPVDALSFRLGLRVDGGAILVEALDVGDAREPLDGTGAWVSLGGVAHLDWSVSADWMVGLTVGVGHTLTGLDLTSGGVVAYVLQGATAEIALRGEYRF